MNTFQRQPRGGLGVFGRRHGHNFPKSVKCCAYNYLNLELYKASKFLSYLFARTSKHVILTTLNRRARPNSRSVISESCIPLPRPPPPPPAFIANLTGDKKRVANKTGEDICGFCALKCGALMCSQGVIGTCRQWRNGHVKALPVVAALIRMFQSGQIGFWDQNLKIWVFYNLNGFGLAF